MQRRSFIRVWGGGVICAAVPVAVSQAVAQSMPADAPWSGPPADVADVRRWALAHAILAPNPHNLQPWLVDLREPNTITLHCDGQRLLPHTDPYGRQILIGHGCFIELLALALAQKGYRAEVALFTQGLPGRELADLSLHPVARITIHSGASADSLFEQIGRRHTPKVDFDRQRPVGAAALQTLLAVSTHADVHVAASTETPRVQALRDLCLAAARVEVETERTMMESMRLLRVGPDEINQHRDGISNNSWKARFAVATGLFDRSQFPKPGSTVHRETMARYQGQCQSAMGFVWVTTPDNRRMTQIQAGREFVRLQLAGAQLGLGVHPMSQSLQEFPEMRPHYEQVHRLLLGRAAPRDASEPTVQMLCRLGYPAETVEPTPRRPLGAFLTH